MPSYFIDFEFIEGFHNPLFGKRRHFIDMISVGIVSGDGKREYYAISTDFNPKDADDWVKKNVISKLPERFVNFSDPSVSPRMKQESLLWKSNRQIVTDLLGFFGCEREDGNWYAPEGIEVYGYYADYDWVLLCSLFGRMVDLPKGFPMHCIDLKQILDTKVDKMIFSSRHKFDIMGTTSRPEMPLLQKLDRVKAHPEYPKQTNEHNALADAKWNHKLYDFLQTIQCIPA
jgi:hypothetical protein